MNRAKRRSTLTRQHGTISQKAVIFIYLVFIALTISAKEKSNFSEDVNFTVIRSSILDAWTDR
jgi:hypothetical protein